MDGQLPDEMEGAGTMGQGFDDSTNEYGSSVNAFAMTHLRLVFAVGALMHWLFSALDRKQVVRPSSPSPSPALPPSYTHPPPPPCTSTAHTSPLSQLAQLQVFDWKDFEDVCKFVMRPVWHVVSWGMYFWAVW